MTDTFLQGLVWGAGLMVSVIVLTPIYFLVNRYFIKQIANAFSGIDFGDKEKKFSRSAGVKVAEFRFESVEDGVRILGALENTGTDAWENIQLVSDWFDEKGQLMRQETDHAWGALEPGEKQHFSFEIECEDLPARIEVHPAAAYFVKPDGEEKA